MKKRLPSLIEEDSRYCIYRNNSYYNCLDGIVTFCKLFHLSLKTEHFRKSVGVF